MNNPTPHLTREIKFRAWNKKEKKMSDEFSFSDFDSTYFIPEGWYLEGGEMEIMQYTGLHDKNGVEIYEGDLVSVDGDIFEVEYGMQGVDAFVGMGWNLWSFYDYDEDGRHQYNLNRLIKSTEVIGNVFETPELLPPN